MTTSVKPVNFRQAMGRGPQFAVVGVQEDGREIVLALGRKREDVAFTYSLLGNCPFYVSVQVRDLYLEPLGRANLCP